MSGKHHNGLSDKERQAMQSLSHREMPPRDLEERTVHALKDHGLIETRKGGILMKLSLAVGALVAIVLVFATGVTIGKKGQSETIVADTAGEKQFILLLYEDNSPEALEKQAEMTQAQYAEIVDEYRNWGVQLAGQGRLVGAEKLKDDAFILEGELRTHDHAEYTGHQGLPEGRVLGGYFLISATNIDHARELAQGHPHLRHGGEIEIRPLDLRD